MHNLVSELEQSIKGDVLSDKASLGIYSTDASIYQIQPLAICLPKDTEDVYEAIRLAEANKVTILPRGAGTSLAGQTVGESLILDFSKYMNEVIELNVEEKWVRVQPGMARDDLNNLLAPHKLHFAPDPATSSRANVGGMVGNNSSGTKSIIYGKTVDHILEANVVLSDNTNLHLKPLDKKEWQAKASQDDREGEIYRNIEQHINKNKEEIRERFPKVMRRVGGYNLDEFIDTDTWNLSKLITGSEGTLATTTELKLNLEPLPTYKSVCVVHYAELSEAIQSVEGTLQFNPSAVEILDEIVIGLSRENLTTSRHTHFIEGNPEAILIIEFYSEDKKDVMDRANAMIDHLKANKFGYAYPLFFQGKEYEDVWTIRKKGLGLMLGIKGEKKPLPFIEDAGIPAKHLPEYIDKVLKVCKKHDTKVAMYAHASVGVIHVRPILDLRQAEDIERLRKITDETFELVVSYGGSWCGEHGDGLVRSAYNQRFFGDQIYEIFKDIKKIFDPENRMNPGKIVEAQTIEHNLRYGTDYKDENVSVTYKYNNEGSFREAVHMCSGVGECRKMLGGTMCPSFKATRDEEDSTRGRANALRLAMSGQLDKDGLDSERIHEVMDLCLSCKACKSECPSNVDMAKLKADIQQLYMDKNGISLRDKLIGSSSKMASKMAGWKAGVVNKVQKTKIFKSVLEHTVGFDRRRALPEYTDQPFYKWFKNNRDSPINSNGKQVVLFADTYINFHEPNIGVSALELLEACGYEVILANVGCCQRSKISHGFLRDAKKGGFDTLKRLEPYFDKGLKVVVCEPSCASALNDDLPDLIDDELLAKKAKENIMMIDVFIANAYDNGELDCEFEIDENIAIHGHCHQKALYGTDSMKKLLSSSENGKSVEEIPSGCCGMAGSFGYEKEHYELSKKIANSILVPHVKELPNDTEVVACGISCRHQIADLADRKPKHWVEVIKVKKK